MPNPARPDYDRLDAMSDDELRQILREDASKPQGEDTDLELTLHVMEVLAARRNSRGEGKSPAQALDSFRQNYCTSNENNLISEKVIAFPKTHKAFIFKRFAAIAAVLILVFTCSAVSANAWGFDFWDTIIAWTQETFHLCCFGQESTPEEPTPNRVNPCQSLQAALNDYEVTQKLVPTWMPEGYEESDVSVQESPQQRCIFASYQSNDDEIFIRISDYLGRTPSQIEQSENLLEIYESENIQYYIFDNFSFLQTVWINDSFECYIISTLTVDEIKAMIDSIQEG